jgi:flagellar L-ring protein precursor FlgH
MISRDTLFAGPRIAVLLTGIAACGPPHIAPFTPRQRLYSQGAYAQSDAKARPSTGSLFSDAVPGYLEDTRALRVGDLMMINIDENADASGAASTALSRTSTGQSGFSALMGLVPALKKAYPKMDTKNLFNYQSASAFTGTGSTARNGQLSGTIAVRVARMMPNGDLFLEGTKVVMINTEEYHLYVSGLVRPTDIQQDNSVLSSRIADAQIEFTGRGDLADQQRKGWGARLLDAVNPF